jgi:hypothetical protein
MYFPNPILHQKCLFYELSFLVEPVLSCDLLAGCDRPHMRSWILNISCCAPTDTLDKQLRLDVQRRMQVKLEELCLVVVVLNALIPDSDFRLLITVLVGTKIKFEG